jgi:uncharacterized delta-60 repeat protein
VVAFANSGFYIYGEHGRALTVALPIRLDGQDRAAKPAAGWWRGFANGHDLSVLGGETGISVFRFNDPFLVEPVAATVPSGVRNVTGVVFDRDTFTAVGGGGAIVTSTDAKTWALSPSATTTDLHGIATFNNTLVAIGDRGTVVAQDVTGAWQRVGVPTSELLLGVAASDTAAIIVGGSGTMLRSTTASIAPTITAPPASMRETLGGAASFTVRAAGSQPLTYQWYHDGVPLAGETRADLTLVPLIATDAGLYSVRVTNSSGALTSPAATLSLLPRPTPVVDATFVADPALDGMPNGLLPLPDGSVLVANGKPNQLVKLKPDGSLDPTWMASSFGPVSESSVPTFTLFALQSDGRILVGGGFSQHNGAARANLIRLNADGTWDPSFVPVAEAVARRITSIDLQSDGKILIANGGTTPLRLLPGGGLDPDFRPEPLPPAPTSIVGTFRDFLVWQVSAAPAGKALVVARADTGISSVERGLARSIVYRIAATGGRDSTFSSVEWLGRSNGLRVLNDGGFLVIKVFAQPSTFPTYTSSASRYTADGTGYPGYGSPRLPEFGINTIYPDGRIVYGSSLDQFSPIRLTALGGIDPTFTGGVGGGSVYAVMADGRLLVVGPFSVYDGLPVNRVVRLNSVPNETPNPPQILAIQAEKTVVAVGETVTLRPVVTGSAQLTYIWDGVPTNFTGTTTASPVLRFAFSTAETPRRVRLIVRNNRGSATSEYITFNVVPDPPVFVRQPTNVSAQLGRELRLAISINSDTAGNCTFDWYRNGQPLTTSAAFDLHLPSWYFPKVTPADAGTYTVVARNAAGVTTTSAPIELTIGDSSRLANLSTRASINSPNEPLIAGFVISGSSPRTVLIRGIGPGLARLGVSNTLADPQITLFSAEGRALNYSNDDWSGPSLAPAFERVGAFPLEGGSKDAAVIATVSPGNYTVQLTGKAGATGATLIEIYEADTIADRLLNISTRATVSASSPATAGFVISGPAGKRVLIRAVGPGLAAFGVNGAHANPRLDLRAANGASLAVNDDWQVASDGPAIDAATAAVGAFPLTAGSRDAALLLTLAPGNYTALVESTGATSGVVLAEIYEVP